MPARNVTESNLIRKILIISKNPPVDNFTCTLFENVWYNENAT